MSSKWNHPQCWDCWVRTEKVDDPDVQAGFAAVRAPVRMTGMSEAELNEKCCFCGRLTIEGIYRRMNPADAALQCGGLHDGEQDYVPDVDTGRDNERVHGADEDLRNGTSAGEQADGEEVPRTAESRDQAAGGFVFGTVPVGETLPPGTIAEDVYCDCELRNRRWNPSTMKCEFCKRRYQ